MVMSEKVNYLKCSLPGCDNPLTRNQRKFCSRKCLIKNTCSERRGIYSALGENSGPRSMISKSSIRKDESHVTGNGEFVVDDYPIDPDIFAIAEANHEKYILDRNEYEARVVIDGLTIFQEEYNKHHDITYQMEQAKKREANLTEDQKIARAIQSKRYQKENKEKIRAKQKARYKANPEKYRKIHRDYYHKNKNKIKKYHKKYYEENIKKPELFNLEQWLRKKYVH
jgi:hypothetical protein